MAHKDIPMHPERLVYCNDYDIFLVETQVCVTYSDVRWRPRYVIHLLFGISAFFTRMRLRVCGT